jgi:hypothetical protein
VNSLVNALTMPKCGGNGSPAMTCGSTNRAKAVTRLGRVHARVGNVPHEFVHRVANQLVKTHDRLALEDLNVTGMLRNHRLAGAISDVAWRSWPTLSVTSRRGAATG